MKPELISFDMKVSGNSLSDCTLFFSDIFNLFPSSFDGLIAYYERDYRVISYTDSGFDNYDGVSKIRYDNLADYADDIIEWLEVHQEENIVFIAHSVNALLAFMIAHKAPHLLMKIIVTSAVPSLVQDAASRYTCGFPIDKLDDVFATIISKEDKTTTGGNLAPAIQLTDILALAFENMSTENAKSIFDIITRANCKSFLHQIQVPTVILQVLADRIATLEAGYLMHRNIPDSQFIRIKAKGHLPQIAAPEELIQAINFFLIPAVVY